MALQIFIVYSPYLVSVREFFEASGFKATHLGRHITRLVLLVYYQYIHLIINITSILLRTALIHYYMLNIL